MHLTVENTSICQFVMFQQSCILILIIEEIVNNQNSWQKQKV